MKNFSLIFVLLLWGVNGFPLSLLASGGEGDDLKTGRVERASGEINKNIFKPSSGTAIIKNIRVQKEVSKILIRQDGKETSEDGGSVRVFLSLTKAPIAEVKIRVKSLNQQEALVSPTFLNFNSKNWKTPKAVIVTGQDDDKRDGNQKYEIEISVDASRDYSYFNLPARKLFYINKDNDSASVEIKPVVLKTSEDGGTGMFFMRLSARPVLPLQIFLKSENKREGRLVNKSFYFDGDNWDRFQKVIVEGVDDLIDDGTCDYRVSLENVVTEDRFYRNLEPFYVRFQNFNNDEAGIITKILPGKVSEDGDFRQIAISLKTQPLADVDIGIFSSDLREAAPEPDRLKFSAENWQTPQLVSIIGIEDAEEDGDQLVKIHFKASESVDLNYQKLEPIVLPFRNRDNDKAGIIVQQPLNAVDEKGSSVYPGIKLATRPKHNVIINLESNDLSEGIVNQRQVIFTPSNWFQEQKIKVTGVDDGEVDGDQVFSIITSLAVSKDPRYDQKKVDDLTIVNKDDDRIGFVIHSQNSESCEDGSNASFLIRLTSQPYYPVKISFKSSDLSEGVVKNKTIIFSPENWNIEQTVYIEGQKDELVDGTISYAIEASQVFSKDQAYHGLIPKPIIIRNIDLNQNQLLIEPKQLISSENKQMALLDIRLGARPKGIVKVKVQSSDEKEGKPEKSEYMFSPDNWKKSQQIRILGVDDNVKDGDQPYTISIETTSEKDKRYQSLGIRKIELMNQDNDRVGVQVNVLNNETGENGEEAQISICLTSQPSSTVAFILASSDPTEGKLIVEHLAFTPENWHEKKIIRIKGEPDHIVDGDQSYFLINPGGAISKDKDYNKLQLNAIPLVNKEQDFANLVIKIQDAVTNENGGTASFFVALNSIPKDTVTLKITSQNSSEGLIINEKASFSSKTWNIPQKIMIKGIDDGVKDGDQFYSVKVSVTQTTDQDYQKVVPQKIHLKNKDRMNLSIGVTYSAVIPVGKTGQYYQPGEGTGIVADYTWNEKILLNMIYQQTHLKGDNKFWAKGIEQHFEYDLNSTTILVGGKYRSNFMFYEGGAGFCRWDLQKTNKNNQIQSRSSGNSGVLYIGVGGQIVMWNRYELLAGYQYQRVETGVDNYQWRLGVYFAL